MGSWQRDRTLSVLSDPSVPLATVSDTSMPVPPVHLQRQATSLPEDLCHMAVKNVDVEAAEKVTICRRWMQITRKSLEGARLLRCTAILQGLALASATVALLVPYWEEWDDPNGDIYSGLWYMCIFRRCGALLRLGIKEWLVTVQVLMSLSVAIQVSALACLLVQRVLSKRFRHYRRVLTGTSIALLLITIILSTAGVGLYGVKQGLSSGTLAWGFFLACASPVLLLPALLCSVLLLRRQSHLAAEKRPILKHSVSTDHSLPVTPMKAYSRPTSPVLTRERTNSEIRMRTTSCSALMPNSVEKCKDKTPTVL